MQPIPIKLTVTLATLSLIVLTGCSTFMGPGASNTSRAQFLDEVWVAPSVRGRAASDLKAELNAFVDVLDGVLSALQTFQLATNVGPTISVMPHVVADLVQKQLDLATMRQKLNTIVH